MSVRGILARPWRYAGDGSRDARLDLLRGFAVFAMAVDHVGGPSPFHWLSGGDRFLVSAAEAFVFISGVTLGLVYVRMAGGPLTAVFRRAWTRAWTLYAIAVWLGLAIAAASAVFDLPRGAPFRADPLRFVVDLVLLRRTYYLVEVMLLYAFLMAMAPLAVALLRRGRWWAVLGCSFALWAAFQRSPGELTLPWAIADYRNFPLAAWQVVFFVGLTIGYHRAQLGRLRGRLPGVPLPGSSLIPLAAAVAALIWLHATDAAVLDHLGGHGYGARFLNTWFDKAALPLPRLLAAAVVFAFAWQVATRAWGPLAAVPSRLLLPFGHATLYAYSAHVVVATILDVAVFRAGLAGRLNAAQSFGIQAAMLLVVWSATMLRLGQRQVEWLGRPPATFARASLRLALRPAPSMIAVGLLLAVSGYGLSRESIDDPGRADAATRRTVYNNPVTTVTPPRATLREEPQPGEEGPTVAEIFDVDGRLEEGMLYSEGRGREMPYAVYLPAAYFDDPARSFPVLYMLHGAGGRYTEWSVYGLPGVASRLLAEGAIEPMIIVMPEGDRGYWTDGLTGDGELWSTYMIQDVVPFIDANYRTLASTASRAIGGLSRGGFGALYLGFTEPQVFGVVGAHSPALPWYGDVESPAIAEEDFPAYDPITIAALMDPATAPRLMIDIGADDDWRGPVEQLVNVLEEREIPVAFALNEGGHVQEYWQAHMDEYLEYYSAALDWSAGIAAVPVDASNVG